MGVVGFTELTRFVFGLSVAATVYSSCFAAWILLIRQPAWRRVVARYCLVGMLLLPFSCWAAPLGRIDWLARLARFFTNLHLSIPRPDPLFEVEVESVLLLLQIVAFCLATCFALFGWLAAKSIERTSYEPDPSILELYGEIVEGLPKPPNLRISTRITRPILLGIRRPMIVLPRGLVESGDTERLRLALLHELAHAKAGDFGFQVVAILARVIGVLIPPVWIIQSQMRLDHEILADREASELYGTGRSYARTLLAWAAGIPTRLEAIGERRLAGVPRQGSALADRIAMMVKCPYPIDPEAPLWWRAFAAFCTLVGLLGASALSIAPSTGAMTLVSPSVVPGIPPSHQEYGLSSLTLGPSPPQPDGRVRPVALPIPLTETFDLTMNVETDAVSLSRMRVAGFPIPIAQLDEIVPGEETFQTQEFLVRVQRTEKDVTIWVEEQEVAHRPIVPSAPTRLTIEPPPKVKLRIHDLRVRW